MPTPACHFKQFGNILLEINQSLTHLYLKFLYPTESIEQYFIASWINLSQVYGILYAFFLEIDPFPALSRHY